MAFELSSEAKQRLYERLVDTHSSSLYRLAFRLCGDRTLAEDIVQETFVEAWRSLGKLQKIDSAAAWMAQILRHVWYRSQRSEARQLPRDDVPVESLELPLLAEDCLSEDRLQEALDQINPLQREAFLMVALEGFHCAEVAGIQKVPTGTVLSRIHRARQALRRLLGAEDKETQPKLRLLRTNAE